MAPSMEPGDIASRASATCPSSAVLVGRGYAGSGIGGETFETTWPGGTGGGFSGAGGGSGDETGSGFRSTSTIDGITGLALGFSAAGAAGTGAFVEDLDVCRWLHHSQPTPTITATRSKTARKSLVVPPRLDERISRFGTSSLSQTRPPNPSAISCLRDAPDATPRRRSTGLSFPSLRGWC